MRYDHDIWPQREGSQACCRYQKASSHADKRYFLLQCIFQPGHGWRKEAYQCVCRRNHYVVDSHQAPLTRASLLNTTQWESDELRSSSTTMPLLPGGQISLPMMKQYPLGVPAQCALCEPDCDICTNGSPCFYTYNLTLRYPINPKFINYNVISLWRKFLIIELEINVETSHTSKFETYAVRSSDLSEVWMTVRSIL